MRVNLEWLRDWTAIGNDPAAVAAALTNAGLEVDELLPAAEPLENVVVARVNSVRPHPNASRLNVCEVDDGAAIHQVVCGAPNVAPGLLVPFARVGARLPGGKTIAAAELRGVTSEGMLCSGRELGLTDDTAGLLVLEPAAPLGAALGEHLRLDDWLLEVNVTPNRGDCFSVLGIAREIAAAQGSAMRPTSVAPVAAAIDAEFPVELAAGERCPRFAARVVHNVTPGKTSPLWLRERLRRAGLRAISPVVDVTNYVMLEFGQPLHAYDLTKLTGRIIVRCAAAGERLTLLDGKSVELADDVLVIADESGPIGLAGIMGGEKTAVGDGTTSILFESAFFTPAAIAGRARRYGMHTDASMRFERGVDPAQQARAVERATQLLLDICGGEAGPVTLTERAADLPHRAPVALRRARLHALLGTALDDADVVRALEPLELKVEPAQDGWRVTPPPFRFDVAIEEDLVEEVGRRIGYDRIPVTPTLTADRLGDATESRIAPDRLADVLVARGYSEVITYSFVDLELEEAVNPGVAPVKLENPIASDLAVMRRSLWPGLLGAAQHNLAHQRTRLRLFEIGPQFEADVGGARETEVIAGFAIGPRSAEHWDGASPDVDFFDVKGDVEALLKLTGRYGEVTFEPASHPALSPGRTARVKLGGAGVGWLGALHPQLQDRIDRKRTAFVFALQIDAAFAAAIPAYRQYSKFPSIRRDLAVVVDEQVAAAAVVNAARESAGALLQNLVVFDVYRGSGVNSGRKSIGLGLILQDASRTLTDADADRTMASVTLRLERELGATIRTT